MSDTIYDAIVSRIRGRSRGVPVSEVAELVRALDTAADAVDNRDARIRELERALYRESERVTTLTRERDVARAARGANDEELRLLHDSNDARAARLAAIGHAVNAVDKNGALGIGYLTNAVRNALRGFDVPPLVFNGRPVEDVITVIRDTARTLRDVANPLCVEAHRDLATTLADRLSELLEP